MVVASRRLIDDQGITAGARLLPVLLLLFGCHRNDKYGSQNASEDTGDEVVELPPPEPINVVDWREDVAVAEDFGDTRGVPTAIALPDGTLFASWTETQPDDGGETCSEEVKRSTEASSVDRQGMASQASRC